MGRLSPVLWQVGLGNYDMRRSTFASADCSVQKKYQLATDVERQLAWMTPLEVEDGSGSVPEAGEPTGGPRRPGQVVQASRRVRR